MTDRPDKDYFPLTPTQKSIWYSEKLYPATGMGNIAATLRIQSAVDYEALELSINLFLQKNDAVRIRIIEKDGEPFQYVTEYRYRTLDRIDFDNNLPELFKWDELQARTPIDVIESDLFQFVLIRINDQDGGFFVKFHHLIADAWTMTLLGNSVMEYYTALIKREPIADGPKPSFIDYVQNDAYIGSTRFHKDKTYWEQKFADWQEVTALKNRKTGYAGTKARRKTLLIPAKLTAKIHEYCAQNAVSEFSLFLAAISMYINRVTHKEDLVFGTTFLNRSNAREKDTVGMFANVAVPVRFFVHEDLNLHDLVKSVSKEIMTVLRHQKYPYDLLLKDVREKKGTKDNLFDIVLTYQNSKFLKQDHSVPYITRWHFNGHQLESLIINLNDRENDGRLIIDYDYLTDMFYATEIEFIHNHVQSLLWHALDNPVKKIHRLEMLSEKEKQKVLYKFNETQANFPALKTVPQLFEEQVERTPDHIAVVFGDEQLTYRELNHRSNQLARLLRARGVKPDSIVGLMLERSLEMVVGIFAILKAGGAYLPLDPQHSRQRTRYMLEDCRASILLADRCLDDEESLGVAVLNLRDAALFTGDSSNPDRVNQPHDLAYVIYTSGSTGHPKGVMIEHRSLINRIHWMQKKYPLDESSVILQKTTYTFDVSVWELVWWSFVGARVCMLEPGGEKDPLVMIRAIQKYHVTTMHFVPSMLSIFLHFLESHPDIHALASLKQVFASGEALNLKQVEQFNRLLHAVHGTELANLYGPTEAAIDVTSFDCSPQVNLKTVPIGKPIDNIQLYILDKHLNPLPIGIPGELFIGGVGVARGYINKPELTAEKFIPNPFNPGERLYRTGDLVRWYAQGDIEYLGRLDHQIKLRGFRIELGEIENRLLSHPGIKEAVVVGVDDKSRQYLCAYYAGAAAIAVRDLKRYLAVSLPEYMVPSYFIHMAELPLSANGKIDRKNLPLPHFSPDQAQAEYTAPRDELDRQLLEVVQGVLETDNLGIDDDFFDLGADSLSVMMIFSRLYEYNRALTAADIYANPTIRELADRMSDLNLLQQSPAATAPIADIASLEPRPEAAAVGAKHEINRILLTGATGFLGAHILSELMVSTESVVYCLVRAKSQSLAAERLKKTLGFYFGTRYHHLIGTRILAVKGDIGRECFGLNAEDYTELGHNVDTVIHCAAIVKYFGDYAQIARANVSGTEEICTFALNYKLKLNHISTDAVTGNYLVRNNVSCTFTENDFYVGQNYRDNHYVRSKFEAENIVYKAMQSGLKATVFRMGNLTGRYTDGQFQPNIGENGFYSTFRSLIQLGAIAVDLLSEDIELSPVDLSAEAVVKILLTQESDNRIFHILNHRKLKMDSLVRRLTGMGFSFRILTQPEMKRFLREELDEAFKHEVLPGMMVYMNADAEIAGPPSITIDSGRSVRYLEKLGFEWPDPGEGYLRKMVRYMRDVHYLLAK